MAIGVYTVLLLLLKFDGFPSEVKSWGFNCLFRWYLQQPNEAEGPILLSARASERSSVWPTKPTVETTLQQCKHDDEVRERPNRTWTRRVQTVTEEEELEDAHTTTTTNDGWSNIDTTPLFLSSLEAYLLFLSIFSSSCLAQSGAVLVVFIIIISFSSFYSRVKSNGSSSSRLGRS